MSDSNKRIDPPASEPGGPAQWLRGNLVGLGSAAVLAVYAAGFERTRAAAAKFSEEAAGRRPHAPIRTTGEIGGLKPRTSDSTHAPQPKALAAKPDSHVVAKTTAAASKPEHVSNAKTVQAQPAGDTVKSPAAVAPPPSVSAHDSTPAPPKFAEAPVATKPASPPADTTQSEKEIVRKDGTYTGWGTSRHGDIQATVQIKDGKIVFAAISECLTQYSCSWIAALPPQVLARQSADVDIVSGATQSTNAFYYAVIEALNKAK